ncbi:hypothetical protein [Chitinilyticum piscinae]|uniref:Uncharacterized protein n=1 Tax=Chitinilyticum piscinae TaxID=2866724 RepID=A0A8J7FIM9_9NEIS|nr:hypothetical protein [Chitinilyticum piscinae]MBE9608127.1 hypothetical protein [Chitinilyticum piscinae]
MKVENIFIFFLALRLLLWLLHRYPRSIVSRVAFAWVGPLPTEQELFAHFQLRWAIFSFGWLCHFAITFTFLYMIGTYFPNLSEQVWFEVGLFAVSLGLGVAVLATLGFLIKAGKAYWFGPNPRFGGFDQSDRAYN